jgi:hypothetical protein
VKPYEVSPEAAGDVTAIADFLAEHTKMPQIGSSTNSNELSSS